MHQHNPNHGCGSNKFLITLRRYYMIGTYIIIYYYYNMNYDNLNNFDFTFKKFIGGRIICHYYRHVSYCINV